jgi:hypothetical protein
MLLADRRAAAKAFGARAQQQSVLLSYKDMFI